MPDQKLTIKAEFVGADQIVQGANKIQNAQDAVADSTRKASAQSKEASAAQDKFKASSEDVASVLNQIAPGLGQYYSAAVRASKVVGDLAGQGINLKGVFDKLKGAVLDNAGSLKLLAAGGAVAAGIWAITKALEAEEQEHRRVTRAIEDQAKALDDLESKRRERQQSIEDISDERAKGGFTADQADAANATAERIAKRSKSLDEGAIKQVVGTLGGANDSRSGGTFSIDELEQLSFLQQTGRLKLDPARSTAFNERQSNRGLKRFRSQIDTFFNRERGQGALSASEARSQAVSGTSPSTDLAQFARPFIPEGQNEKAVLQAVQEYGNLAGLSVAEDRKNVQRVKAGGFVSEVLQAGGAQGSFPPEVVATARAILTELESINSNLGKASRPTNVRIDRAMFPSSRAFEDTVRNGDSVRRVAEY